MREVKISPKSMGIRQIPIVPGMELNLTALRIAPISLKRMKNISDPTCCRNIK